MEDRTSFLSRFSMFDNVLHDMMDLVSCFPTLEMECSQTCQNLSCLRVPPLPFDLIAQLNDYIFVKTCLPVNIYDFSFPQINAVANKSISKQSKHNANINHVRLAFSDLHLQTLDKARAMEGHCRRQHAKGIGRLPGRPVAKGAGGAK